MPESVVEEIKARIDLADLIASYGVQIKRAGSSLKACCPFHHEKTPSFHINLARGFYHCFGCGESGDAIRFVQRQEGLSFMEALRKLAEQCGVKVESKEDPDAERRKRLHALMGELAQFYHRCLLKMAEAAPARSYLVSRALDGAIADDYLIGYAPNGVAPILTWAEKYGYTESELAEAGIIKPPDGPGDRGFHRFGGRLMFTIRDRQARVVAFSGRQLVERKNSGKYVNSPETLIFRKSKVLFGFDRAAASIAKSPHREAIVCEGQIDTIRLQTSGFPTAVASQGTAFTEEHVKMLRKVADAVVLVFDDDAAGHKATIRTARLFLDAEMPVRVVRLPGGDDPDSFLRTKGPEAFQTLLDGAESIIAFQTAVERAKERDSKSIDAVARISKALVETIAACRSAILRASMTDEAARLMGLPVAALNDELAKAKSARPAPMTPKTSRMAEDDDSESGRMEEDGEPASDEPPIPGGDARAVAPPPMEEIAFLQFLQSNLWAPDVKTLDGIVGEFLPETVFAHDFTRRFVSAWRASVASGEDRFASFCEAEGGPERGWYDAVLIDGDKTGSCELRAVDILQDFVRSLWDRHLAAVQGALPAVGDPEADMIRIKISLDRKRLHQGRWSVVKDLIRDWMKGAVNGPQGSDK